MPIITWILAHPELAYPAAIALFSLAKPFLAKRWPHATDALMATGPDLRQFGAALLRALTKDKAPPTPRNAP